MAHEVLRPQDAALLYAQDPLAPLQIGALCVFDAGPLRADDGTLRLDDLRRHIDARLAAIPRFRQRLLRSPFDLAPPVWVDDPDYDVGHHVRLATLPAPGDAEQLRHLVTRLLEEPLDPDRPLWGFWLVDGLSDDRLAVIPKASHVMADGMALLDAALTLLDAEASGPPSTEAPEPAGPLPSSVRLFAVATIEHNRRRMAALLGALDGLRHPDRIVAAGNALLRSATQARPSPELTITSPTGPHRGFAWTTTPMDALLELKRSQGVSINDIVLAAVTGALARVLPDDAGDATPGTDGRRARALVPVSTHGRHPEEEVENHFALLLADLPVAIPDPLDRLRAVHTEMHRRKASMQGSIGPLLFGISDFVPAALLQLVAPRLLRHQPIVNLAVTNLPGTSQTLHLLGARLLELYPFITVTGNLGIIVGVISYGGSLGVSVTVDADVVPDVVGLARALDDAFAELIDAGRAFGPW